MTAEEYLKANNFPNVSIRNKVGVQAYMLSDVLDDYAEKQIKELEEEKDLEILAKDDLQERNEIQFKQIKELEDILPNNPEVMNRDALILRIELSNRILNKH